MTNYFEDIKVDYEELEKERKEMEELIELGRKNKQAYMNMLDDLNKRLDKLVSITGKRFKSLTRNYFFFI